MTATGHNYAIRLSVEDGGTVKANLIDIGKSGDQSFKLLENSAARTSGVLGALTERTELLKRSAAAIGGLFLGFEAINGIKGLIESTVQGTTELAKTADKLGIGVEAYQEFGYAAKLAGVDQEAFNKGMQNFVRRLGEAKDGSGKLLQEFNSMGVSLRDSSGNVRDVGSLLDDVADALKHIHDPAERARIAFDLFGRTGITMVNMLSQGSQGLEAMRQEARDLGIVLDESLVREGEKAGDQLEVLHKVISADLSRAVLDLAPLITDLAKTFTNLAADAGVAYEKTKLFFQGDFSAEGLSKRSVERLYNEYKSQMDELQARLKKVEAVPVPFGNIEGGNDFANAIQEQINNLQPKLDDYTRRYQEMQKSVTEAAQQSKAATEDQLAASVELEQQRADSLTKIESKLQNDLFNITYQGSEKIEAQRKRALDQINALQSPDGKNADQIKKLTEETNQLYDAQLSQLRNQEAEAAGKVYSANEKVVQSLIDERNELSMTDRERFIDQATRRLSADATEAQRNQVKAYAGELYDEKQALEATQSAEEQRKQTLERVKQAMEKHTDSMKQYQDELAQLNQLLQQGVITQEQYAAAVEESQRHMLDSSRKWSAGLVRGLKHYADEATNMAAGIEKVVTGAFQGIEDALVDMVTKGKADWKSMIDSMIADIARLIIRAEITGPLAGALGQMFSGMFGFANGGVFMNGMPLQRFAMGGVVSSPTLFPMVGNMGLMGEAGPEAIMPLSRLPSGRLGVETNGNNGSAYYLTIDARGAVDPQATAAQVETAVDRALSARVPNIVKASAQIARGQVVDSWQRRGGRFG